MSALLKSRYSSNSFEDVSYKKKLHLNNLSVIMLLTTNSGRCFSLYTDNGSSREELSNLLKKVVEQYTGQLSSVKFVSFKLYKKTILDFFEQGSIPYTGVFYQDTINGFESIVNCQEKKIFIAGATDSGEKLKWKPKVKVLVVDDSATIRKILVDCLSDNQDFEVIGEAENGEIAFKKINELKPDIITLDINMPVLDGLGLLKRLHSNSAPTTILISSIVKGEGETVMQCLEEGAFDYIQKPHFKHIESFKKELFEKLELSEASREQKRKRKIHIRSWQGPLSVDYNKNKILTIGASTGGTEAIKEVLLRLPKTIPPTFIVQHIPPVFSAAFAKKLDELCPFKVVEAEQGMEINSNTVYVAPGGKHLGVSKDRKSIIIDEETPAVSSHKPSVDYMYKNLIEAYKARDIIAVILTGMGSDGALGMKEIKDKGGYTIAQDEETSIVYGMPRKAKEFGGVEEVLPLQEIANIVINKLKE